MYSAIAMQVGQSKRHIMPVCRDIFLTVATVDIHAYVVERVWTSKPSQNSIQLQNS